MALRSGSPFAFIGVKAELLRQVSPDRVNRTNECGGTGGGGESLETVRPEGNVLKST